MQQLQKRVTEAVPVSLSIRDTSVLLPLAARLAQQIGPLRITALDQVLHD